MERKQIRRAINEAKITALVKRLCEMTEEDDEIISKVEKMARDEDERKKKEREFLTSGKEKETVNKCFVRGGWEEFSCYSKEDDTKTIIFWTVPNPDAPRTVEFSGVVTLISSMLPDYKCSPRTYKNIEKSETEGLHGVALSPRKQRLS